MDLITISFEIEASSPSYIQAGRDISIIILTDGYLCYN